MGFAGPSALPLNTWSHIAATYDGANQRIFVNGVQVASRAQTGNITTSTGAVRIGGNAIWPEWFSGAVDEVRIYNRALTASQIQSDMTTPISIDTTPPTITAVLPANGATNVTVGPTIRATFSEPMDVSSLTTSFELRDAANTPVPATIAYDANTAAATLTPTGALLYNATYTAVVRGGAGADRAKDASGNALSIDRAWSFTTEPVPPPILVLKSSANAFSAYAREILVAEGIDAFTTLDVSILSPTLLSYFDVVVLGDTPLTATQVTTLTNWVTSGGNLIALRPTSNLRRTNGGDRCREHRRSDICRQHIEATLASESSVRQSSSTARRPVLD